MTDAQLYLALAIPVFAIVTSLIVSLVQVSGIREDMRAMRLEFHSDITSLTGKVIDIGNRLTRIYDRLENR